MHSTIFARAYLAAINKQGPSDPEADDTKLMRIELSNRDLSIDDCRLAADDCRLH